MVDILPAINNAINGATNNSASSILTGAGYNVGGTPATPAGNQNVPNAPVVSPANVSQKPLADMTVAEAAASGQTDAYNKLVAGYLPSSNTPTANDLNTFVNNLKSQNTNPNTPVSSMSSSQNGSITTGAVGSTSPTVTNPTSTTTPPTTQEQAMMDKTGLSVTDLRNLYTPKEIVEGYTDIQQTNQENVAAKAQHDSEMATQVAEAATRLAQTDNDWAILQQKINSNQKTALQLQKGNAYSTNPFAATASATGGGENAINNQYTNFMANAQSQYELARQLEQQGDTAAAAKIDAALTQAIDQNGKDLLSAFSTNAGQATTEKAQEQTTKYQQYEMINGSSDNYQKALTANPMTDVDITKMTTDQIANSQPGQAYAQYLDAQGKLAPDGKMTPDQIAALKNDLLVNQTQAIKNAKTNAQTLQSQSDTAYYNMKTALAGSQLAAIQVQQTMLQGFQTNPLGSSYQNAYQVALGKQKDPVDKTTGYSKQGEIGLALGAGNTQQAKNLLTSVALDGLSTSDSKTTTALIDLYSTVGEIMDRYNSLSPSQKKIADDSGFINGNIASVEQKLGQATDPALTEMADEFTHLAYIYGTKLYGQRAAITTQSAISGLFPSGKNSDTLNIADSLALQNTANDSVTSTMKRAMGADNFSNIFGSKYFGSTPTPPPLTVTPPANTTVVWSASTGHYYAKDASGNGTLIQ